MRAAASPVAPLKYVVGIDIAKDTFVACFGHIDTSQHLSFGKETTFANTLAGFTALLVWTACKLPPKVSQSKIERSSNFSLLLFLTVHEKKSL